LSADHVIGDPLIRRINGPIFRHGLEFGEKGVCVGNEEYAPEGFRIR
jgi:hypothetical protein